MNADRTLILTEIEAWAVEDMIRHTWQDEGRPVGKPLLMKVLALIDEFESRRSQSNPPRDLPLAMTEDECWAIDFHIRRGHVDPTGIRVGKDLLLKVFRLLLDRRAADEVRRLGLLDATDAHETDARPRIRELREFLEHDRAREEDGGTSDEGPRGKS